MMPWGVDHIPIVNGFAALLGCEVTYDAVRRWSQIVQAWMTISTTGEVTYDAVRRWSLDNLDAGDIVNLVK